MVSLAALLFSLTVEGQKSSYTPRLLEFENPVRDLGTVSKEDGAVKLDFEYTNISDKPVVILDTYSQCGICLDGKFDTKPLAPGKSSKVSVTFDPEMKYGEFRISLTVTASNGDYKKYNTLTLSGTVKGGITIEDQKYIFKYGDALRSDKRIVGMRLRNFRTRNITAVLELYNASDREMAVSFSHASMYLKKLDPVTLAPREIREITFTVNPKYMPDGVFAIPVEVRVDGRLADDIMEVTGNIDADFFSSEFNYPPYR